MNHARPMATRLTRPNLFLTWTCVDITKINTPMQVSCTTFKHQLNTRRGGGEEVLPENSRWGVRPASPKPLPYL